MRSLIMSAGQVSTTSYCYKCKKPCRFPYSVLHVSGTPCTDFSSFGKVESTNGPSIAAFLIWAAIILQVFPRILLLENVESFPVSLLESIFGSSYVAQSIVCGSRGRQGNHVGRTCKAGCSGRCTGDIMLRRKVSRCSSFQKKSWRG